MGNIGRERKTIILEPLDEPGREPVPAGEPAEPASAPVPAGEPVPA